MIKPGKKGKISPHQVKAKKEIQSTTKLILNEIDSILSQVEQDSVDNLVEAICNAKKIVTIGAGRVGLANKGFAMRLSHLGLNSYALGDMTVPSIRASGDVALVASGSGETPSIALLAETAKKSGAKVVLITANPQSRIGRMSDLTVCIPSPNKSSNGAMKSEQPMTTLNEQCLHIFFDALVLLLMHRLDETTESMWERHSNLE